jgi:4-hydroxybenzoate polyprenyltransferase
MLCSLAVSLYKFIDFRLITQAVIFLLAVTSVLYPFGLRKIPFFKIIIISFVWSISTMLLLVFENDVVISLNEILHLVARFLFVFAITIPFDIRDLHYDNKNVVTLPLFFGVDKSKLIAFLALGICMLIAGIQNYTDNLMLAHLLAIILLCFNSLIFVWKSNENRGEMYFSFWGEGLSICSYLFLVILLLIC